MRCNFAVGVIEVPRRKFYFRLHPSTTSRNSSPAPVNVFELLPLLIYRARTAADDCRKVLEVALANVSCMPYLCPNKHLQSAYAKLVVIRYVYYCKNNRTNHMHPMRPTTWAGNTPAEQSTPSILVFLLFLVQILVKVVISLYLNTRAAEWTPS